MNKTESCKKRMLSTTKLNSFINDIKFDLTHKTQYYIIYFHVYCVITIFMLDQYPKEINNISFFPIYANALHFAEDALDTGIAEKNFVTGEEYWSPKFFDLLGYSENEIQGTTENFINGIDLTRNGDKIFNLYQTFHNHPEARGIGLYITRNQIESMSGSIAVESIEGKGTIFKINF